MRLILALLVIATLSVVGCSFAKSSKSISDSISSPSKSSTSSSDDDGGGDSDSEKPESKQDAASYGEDISQLATTYAKSGGDIGALRSAVATLATARGITNWEVDPATCQAIGAGVGTGGMTEEEFTSFSKQLFGEDLSKANELRKGYQTTMQAAPVPASEADPEAAKEAADASADEPADY